MKQKIIWVSLLGAALIFIDTTNLPSTLLRFVLVGEVPGTSWILSSKTMLMLWTALGLSTLALWLLPILLRISHSLLMKHNKVAATQFKRALPKRRYSSAS